MQGYSNLVITDQSMPKIATGWSLFSSAVLFTRKVGRSVFPTGTSEKWMYGISSGRQRAAGGEAILSGNSANLTAHPVSCF